MGIVVERGQAPPLREYLYWVLPAALLPLAVTLGRPADDTPDRFRRTLSTAPADVRRRVDAVEHNPDATLDDLLAALPGRRIQGAFLPRDTSRHWLFAALTAAGFLGLTAGLFPESRSSPATLVGVGLFTATAGVVVLLAIQQMIAPTCGVVLDGDGNFVVSLCGYVLGVGLIEEAAKALPLLWRVTKPAPVAWRTACLWGLASGAGFGVAESVFHSERAYNGLATADAYLVRFASCVALHAMWTASVGLGLAAAGRAVAGRREYAVAVLRVLAGPAALHGLYDALLLYRYDAAALVVAIASFGWMAWQVETARQSSLGATGVLEVSPT